MKLYTKPTYYLSILSLGIILFLLGLITLFSLHSKRISAFLKQQQNIVLNLKENIAEADIYVIQQNLDSKEIVNNASIKFISKDEGLKIMQNELNDPELFLNIENPLQDIFQFRVSAETTDFNQLEELKAELTQLSGVISMHYQKDPFVSLDQLRVQINKILLVLMIFMLVFSLVLIYNTLRFILTNQAKRLFTMQMVGAKDSFIMKPYLKYGALMGWWSGVLSILFLIFTYLLLRHYFSIPAEIVSFGTVIFVVMILFLIGVLFSITCTFIIVRNFLNVQEKIGLERA
jgi:cell division transport system permease protein